MMTCVRLVFLYYVLQLVNRYAFWPSIVYFVLYNNRVVDAQLISYSILHHITKEDLLYYNLTHPDDIYT